MIVYVQGAVDTRGFKLMPDKWILVIVFLATAQGMVILVIFLLGTFYLALFWTLSTIRWVTFYCHWKHITLWQSKFSRFSESPTYLMGSLRDSLWLNSSQLIDGYNPFGRC
ncbi:unnamed protein product [Musa acuminata subsp. burmannicoides]